MGEMTRPEIVAVLRRDNPEHIRLDVLHLYADAFLEYEAAQANIAEHGAIVFHPRTGAPIQNPYCAIRDKASAQLAKLAKMRVKADALWPHGKAAEAPAKGKGKTKAPSGAGR